MIELLFLFHATKHSTPEENSSVHCVFASDLESHPYTYEGLGDLYPRVKGLNVSFVIEACIT